MKPDCGTCKYLGADPDGAYCGHPQAFNFSWAGLNLNRARGPNHQYTKEMMKDDPAIGVCGPDGKLYEEREG